MVRDGALLARTGTFEGGKTKALAFGLLLALVVAGLLLTAKPAQAETYEVNVSDDVSHPNECGFSGYYCSLRSAVAKAQLTPGHDYIVIQPSVGDDIRLLDGPILVDNQNLTIDGNGATIEQRSETGGGEAFRLCSFNGGGNLVLDELEITSFSTAPNILVCSFDNLYLTNSTLNHNYGNSSSGASAGVRNRGGTMLVNSTVSGTGQAGIDNEGHLEVYSSTITDNVMGVRNGTGTSALLYRSIVAGNHYRDVEGPFSGSAFNIVGNGDGSTGLTGGVGSRVGTTADPVDPGLRPLGFSDPGPDIPLPPGPTPTHPLRIDSPAVDAVEGSQCPLYLSIPGGGYDQDFDTDQRGVARPWGPACDIGAFERRPHPVITFDDAYSTEEGTTLTVGASGVLGNDDDWGSPIVVAQPRPASDPAHGTLTLEEDGSFTYTPDAGFTGTDTFTYKASHGGLLTSDPATVTITVTPEVTPPVLNLPGEGDPKTVTELATSAAGATVSFVATATDQNPSNPRVSCSVNGDPIAPGDTGDDSFRDTFPVGTTTVGCSATDAAGNTANGSFRVSVLYDWSGFLSPVNNPEWVNKAKAGSAIPVKFGLGGDMGLDVFYVEANGSTYPKSAPMTCASTDPVDAIEQTVSASSSGLSYDEVSGRYNYVWKTNSGWAGTCRQLVIKLADGTIQRANFKFTK